MALEVTETGENENRTLVGIENKRNANNDRIGIGMDSAVIPLKKHGLSLVQTVDFFYPLIDNPFIMGKIALANVVSDVYAVGVTNIDKITLIMSIPVDFTDAERDIIAPLMIKGFQESAKEAGCTVKIGGLAINPWCIIGGVATAICSANEMILPSRAQPKDVLVLTKPLGTQLATNSYLWMIENSDNWQKIKDIITVDDIKTTYLMAVESMSRLNLIGARLMHKHKAHAATDVTGFGLLGHAENLAKFQQANVSFIIHTLPIIKNCRKIAEQLQQLKLLTGKAVETSGGLLIAMPAEESEMFCQNYKNECGYSAWIVGVVNDGGNGSVELDSNVTFIDVDEF